jgi:uncharacterized membrane protein SpoIIM required for sporulation
MNALAVIAAFAMTIITVTGVVVSYYTLVPAWNLYGNAVTNVYQGMSPSSSDLNAFNTLMANLNIAFQYGILAILLGALAFLLVYTWHHEYDTGQG